MDPKLAMTWCILSTDPDFINAMAKGLASGGMEVYIATSWEEYELLQQEGAVFEGLVVDPIHRLADPVPAPPCKLVRQPQRRPL